MTAASTIPTRKSAGSRKRSDRNNRAALRGGRRRSGFVPDPPHGRDRRRIAELLPQLPDVHVDRAGVAGERVAPNALEELVAREDETTMVEQLPEEVELLRREPDLR